jgi:hypothetical protein
MAIDRSNRWTVSNDKRFFDDPLGHLSPSETRRNQKAEGSLMTTCILGDG